MLGDNDFTTGFDRRTALKVIGATGIASVLSGGTAAAQDSEAAAAARRGPLRNNRFTVEIGGGPAAGIAGFLRANLPNLSTDAVEYREGNDLGTARQLDGDEGFESLVLERGVKPGDSSLYDWYALVEEEQMAEARVALAVNVLDRQHETQMRWEFTDAWPARYDPPDLDAMAEEIATETVEVLFDDVDRTL